MLRAPILHAIRDPGQFLELAHVCDLGENRSRSPHEVAGRSCKPGSPMPGRVGDCSGAWKRAAQDRGGAASRLGASRICFSTPMDRPANDGDMAAPKGAFPIPLPRVRGCFSRSQFVGAKIGTTRSTPGSRLSCRQGLPFRPRRPRPDEGMLDAVGNMGS